jgi:hypothetical protein
MSESSLSLQHSSGYGQIQGPAISSGIPALGYPIILFWSMKLQRNQRTMMKTMVNGTLQHGFWYFISDVLKEHQTMLAGRNSLGSSRKSFVARSAAREPPSDFRLVQLARRQGPLSVSCDLELVKMGRDA